MPRKNFTGSVVGLGMRLARIENMKYAALCLFLIGCTLDGSEEQLTQSDFGSGGATGVATAEQTGGAATGGTASALVATATGWRNSTGGAPDTGGATMAPTGGSVATGGKAAAQTGGASTGGNQATGGASDCPAQSPEWAKECDSSGICRERLCSETRGRGYCSAGKCVGCEYKTGFGYIYLNCDGDSSNGCELYVAVSWLMTDGIHTPADCVAVQQALSSSAGRGSI